MSIIELFNLLADIRQREAAAAALALEWGAEAVIVLIPDPELGTLRPALGFRQTMPGGPSWRHFLAACRQPGEHRGEVAFPKRGRMVAACAHTGADGAVLALLGGAPTLSREEFARLPFPLLSALLCGEAAGSATEGFVAAARDATRRTTAFAEALDRARSETDAKAAELDAAVAEMTRLDRQLRSLNDTLEERVRERSRELERQAEERLKAEAALHKAQKMEALGQMTGGVAHDFNNVLAIVIGSLDLIEAMAGDNPRLRRAVAMAQEAAKRATRLIEQLLAFGRHQMLQPQMIDVNAALGEYRDRLRRAVGEAIAIKIDLSPVPCRVHIDPAQFETAILNLASNARDAMPAGGGIEIETAVCRGPLAEVPDLTSGDHVRITVRDHGLGMPAEIVERVFEPFFTTKPPGKGTGLGLSQVYGFVRQSGGRIAIDSGTGRGTAVHIYLPLASGESIRVARAALPAGSERASPDRSRPAADREPLPSSLACLSHGRRC